MTGIGAALAGLGLAVAGAVAPVAAATPPVTATCDAVSVRLADYPTIPATAGGTERVLTAAAVDYAPAVFGPRPVLTAAHEAVPAVYSPEQRRYLRIHPVSGETLDERWFTSGTPNDASVWTPTGETRQTLITDAVPAVAEVLGDAPLITPEVPARDAVYEDRLVPATPGDDTPNTVSLYLDGVLLFADAFGADYSRSVTIDGTVDHSYSVLVGTPGSVTGTAVEDAAMDGSTLACAIPATPATPGADQDPPVVPPTAAVPPVPVVEDVPVVPAPGAPTVPAPVAEVTPIVPPVPVGEVAPVVPPVPVAEVTPVVPPVPVAEVTPVVPPVPVAEVTPVQKTAPASSGARPAGPQAGQLAATGTAPWSIPALVASLAAMVVGALVVRRRTGSV